MKKEYYLYPTFLFVLYSVGGVLIMLLGVWSFFYAFRVEDFLIKLEAGGGSLFLIVFSIFSYIEFFKLFRYKLIIEQGKSITIFYKRVFSEQIGKTRKYEKKRVDHNYIIEMSKIDSIKKIKRSQGLFDLKIITAEKEYYIQLRDILFIWTKRKREMFTKELLEELKKFSEFK